MKNLTLIKLLLVLAVFITNNNFVNAQNPNFPWVEQAGGSSFDNGRGIATDDSDNIIVTGNY